MMAADLSSSATVDANTADSSVSNNTDPAAQLNDQKDATSNGSSSVGYEVNNGNINTSSDTSSTSATNDTDEVNGENTTSADQ